MSLFLMVVDGRRPNVEVVAIAWPSLLSVSSCPWPGLLILSFAPNIAGPPLAQTLLLVRDVSSQGTSVQGLPKHSPREEAGCL